MQLFKLIMLAAVVCTAMAELDVSGWFFELRSDYLTQNVGSGNFIPQTELVFRMLLITYVQANQVLGVSGCLPNMLDPLTHELGSDNLIPSRGTYVQIDVIVSNLLTERGPNLLALNLGSRTTWVQGEVSGFFAEHGPDSPTQNKLAFRKILIPSYRTWVQGAVSYCPLSNPGFTNPELTFRLMMKTFIQLESQYLAPSAFLESRDPLFHDIVRRVTAAHGIHGLEPSDSWCQTS
ncbi:hypothetical protein FB451DRAFT_1167029 [Mycena latifolia]|nr:hypothetical protein FB451DRAFT_1167029 [Mycena latifolia]